MNKFSIKHYFFSFFKKHVLFTILLVISIILSVIFGLLPSFALRDFLDEELAVMIQMGEYEYPALVKAGFVHFFFYFMVAISTLFENYMIDTFGQKMIRDLRYKMIEKSHVLRSSYYTKHGSGETTSRVTDDVFAIESLFTTGIIALSINLLKIIGIVASVFVFSWALGLILLGVIPFISLITQAFRKRMLKQQIINRKLVGAQTNHLAETITNHQMIENMDKERYREDQFEAQLQKYYKSSQKNAISDAIYPPIVQFLKAFLIAIITLLVAYGSEHPDVPSLGITIGTLAAALNLFTHIFAPIELIGKEMEAMQEGLSGIKRVEDYMNETEISKKRGELTAELVLKEDNEEILTFENVSFRYDDGDKDVLSNINFSIKKGDKISILGRTGAGKTTLFRLILGILEPTRGELKVNGYQVDQIPDPETKYIMGYVQQGFVSIPGTIRDQITMTDEKITDEKIREVMKRVYLDEYVMTSFEKGYDTPFKEELFSRGQLQLLSLARALVFDPQILLLDEISANMDSETEKELLSVLSGATDKHTVISISHRLSEELNFNRRIKVVNGKLISVK